MDITSIKLQELYEMLLKELKNEVDALDGTLDEFDPESKTIAITVDPELQDYLEVIVTDILTKYDIKKDEICSKDPFYGVKDILNK